MRPDCVGTEAVPKKMCQGRRRARACTIRQHIPMLVVDTGRSAQLNYAELPKSILLTKHYIIKLYFCQGRLAIEGVKVYFLAKISQK